MDDIKSKIFGAAKSIQKTSGDILKTTKLNLELSSEEQKLNAIYSEIGKKVAEIYAFGGKLGGPFDDKYAEIVKIQEKIDAIKQKISLTKGKRDCPHCGASAAANAEFCQSCGARLDEAQPRAREPQTPPPPAREEERERPPAPQTRTCPICGSQNEMPNRFCLSCGRML